MIDEMSVEAFGPSTTTMGMAWLASLILRALKSDLDRPAIFFGTAMYDAHPAHFEYFRSAKYSAISNVHSITGQGIRSQPY